MTGISWVALAALTAGATTPDPTPSCPTDGSLGSNVNVYTCGDFTGHGSDAEGFMVIGGDMDVSGYGIASNANPSSLNVLRVGGDLTASDAQVYGGNARVGGTCTTTNLGFSNPSAGLTCGATLDVADDCTDYCAVADYVADLADQNCTVTYQPWGGVDISASGQAVCTLDLDQLPATATNIPALTVTAGPNDTVMVNVVGTRSLWASNGSMDLYGVSANQVLWNFGCSATTTCPSIRSISVKGSLLAPSCAVDFDNGHIDGQYIVGSHEGNGQFHKFGFHGDICVDDDPDPGACVDIEKLVSADGGPFVDADTVDDAPIAPIGAYIAYKLVVENCGDVDLEDLRVIDYDLGIDEVLTDVLAAGDQVVLTREDRGFESMSNQCHYVGAIDNLASVEVDVVVSGDTVQLTDDDAAWVLCDVDESTCGDGNLDEDETCDPPGRNSGDPDECRDDCTFCGDGNVDPVEECDDGNNRNGDGCTATCEIERAPRCGDGDVVAPETCDPPGIIPAGSTNVCRDTCTYCGDGVVNGDELCDDPTDPSCSDTCQLAACALSIEQTCVVPVPDSTGSGKCDGKLEELTMVWTGGTVTVSGVPNDAPSGVVNNGDEVTFSGPFSNNDVVVTLTGAVSGTSTFHVSCSDGDMDGDTDTNDDQSQVAGYSRDCRKSQGNGKGGSGINDWELEGWVDGSGDVLDCTPADVEGSTYCELNEAPPADCDSVGKPDTLTWRYTGGGCAASDNSQEPNGDLFCTGSIDDSLTVTVTDDDGNEFTVAPGDSFTTDRDSSKVLELVNSGGTEESGRHVSCSEPLVAGDVYGSLTLEALDGQGAGQTIRYTYAVSNTGATDVTDVTVGDDQVGPVSEIDLLAVGESFSVSVDVEITSSVTSVATADGVTAGGQVCVAEADPVVVDLIEAPACDVSLSFDDQADDKIKWAVTNVGTETVTLDSLLVDFPVALDAVKEVKVDGDQVYESKKSSLVVGPGDTIGESDWTESKVSKREIASGDEVIVEVKFEDKSKDAVITATLTFAEGCEVSY